MKKSKKSELLTLRVQTTGYLDALRFQGVEKFDAEINILLDMLYDIDRMIEEVPKLETED